MRITDLSRTKRGRYAVSVEGQYLFSLHEEVFYTARLAVWGPDQRRWRSWS